MRILILCKRQYTGRDLLNDRYGRLYALPIGLAARGHNVVVVTSSYRKRGAVNRIEDGVRWCSIDLLPWPFAIEMAWQAIGEAFKPDVVVASSDAPHLIWGARFAHRMERPIVLDFYDDYEAFGLTRLPGLCRALRKACVRADAVMAVSGALADMLPSRGIDQQRIHLLENGVPFDFALKMNREEARRELRLPAEVPLVGTAGALTTSRGIGDLLKAVDLLQKQRPDLRLVLAGPRDAVLSSTMPPNTIDLGHLSHAMVAVLFRALDVGVICNRDGAFARACYPMRLAEMVASGTPVVAADLGEVSRLLMTRPDARYSPGYPDTLATRIAVQLDAPRPLDPALAKDWPLLSARLEAILEGVLKSR